MLKRSIIIVFAIGLLFANTAFATSPTILTITNVEFSDSSAIADNTFENGWRLVFDITVPENETVLRIKLSDWISGLNIVPTANNVRVYSPQAFTIVDPASSLILTQADVFSGDILISYFKDLDPNLQGTQIKLIADIKIPVGTAEGSYSVNYEVTTSPYVVINDLDLILPVITLNGTNPFIVYPGSMFVDPGATATDDRDGDITGKIIVTGFIDYGTPGIYKFTYNVSDNSQNNATPVVRDVILVGEAGICEFIPCFTE